MGEIVIGFYIKLIVSDPFFSYKSIYGQVFDKANNKKAARIFYLFFVNTMTIMLETFIFFVNARPSTLEMFVLLCNT